MYHKYYIIRYILVENVTFLGTRNLNQNSTKKCFESTGRHLCPDTMYTSKIKPLTASKVRICGVEC